MGPAGELGFAGGGHQQQRPHNRRRHPSQALTLLQHPAGRRLLPLLAQQHPRRQLQRLQARRQRAPGRAVAPQRLEAAQALQGGGHNAGCHVCKGSWLGNRAVMRAA